MKAPPQVVGIFKREGFQVFAGVSVGLAICAVPIFGKGIISGDGKKGHDLFSQEKPEAIDARSDRWAREALERRNNTNSE